jgi:histidine phosphotransferase ChpT
MKPEDAAVLMELLSSRICHDIISPVGAINNGIEFMEDAEGDAEGIKQASELIAHSAQAASARLQAFRIAYGAGGRDSNLKPEDIQKAFAALTRAEGKVRQSWDPYGPLGIDAKTKGFGKVLMGAMMLAADCLPKGGIVTVDAEGSATKIRGEHADAVIRDGVEQALRHETDIATLDPRLIHPYALNVMAKALGFTIESRGLVSGGAEFVIRINQ